MKFFITEAKGIKWAGKTHLVGSTIDVPLAAGLVLIANGQGHWDSDLKGLNKAQLHSVGKLTSVVPPPPKPKPAPTYTADQQRAQTALKDGKVKPMRAAYTGITGNSHKGIVKEDLVILLLELVNADGEEIKRPADGIG